MFINLKEKDWKQGNGLLSPDKSKFFVMVPKNASSSMYYILHENKWEQTNYNSVKCDEYIIIERDPYERWLTGLVQYLLTLTHGIDDVEVIKFLNSPITIRLIKKQLVFDGHTMPQAWFRENLETNKIKTFQFSENVVQEILEYLNIDYDVKHINVSEENPRKILIKHCLDKWDFNVIKGEIK